MAAIKDKNLLLLAPLVLGPMAYFIYLMVRQIANNKCDGLLCQDKCKEGYKNRLGVCWENCKGVSSGALCRERCRDGYKDVAGVCWFDKCPAGETESGVLCYKPCPTNHKGIGPALCRERCRSGYREVLGVCRKGLRSYVPKTIPRKSDGKLASYVPKTSAIKSEIPKTSFGNKYLIPGYLLNMILLLGIGVYGYNMSQNKANGVNISIQRESPMYPR